MLSDEEYMRVAIQAGLRNARAPFGAIIVDSRDGRLIASGHNRTSQGPLWHGEVDVIDRAAAKLFLFSSRSLRLTSDAGCG